MIEQHLGLLMIFYVNVGLGNGLVPFTSFYIYEPYLFNIVMLW